MNTYLVLKEQSVKGKTRTVVTVDLDCPDKKHNKVVISGNLPAMYQGMTLYIELSPESNRKMSLANDYQVIYGKETLNAFKKADVDIETYKQCESNHKLVKHKGIGWEEAQTCSDNLYDILPFEEADKIHKEMVNNPSDKKRLDAISKKVIENARNRRKIAYGVSEFLSYFDEVEQAGAYEVLLTSIKMLCLQAQEFGFKDNHIWDTELKMKKDFVNTDIRSRISDEFNLLAESEIDGFIDTVSEQYAQEQLDILHCLRNSCPSIVTGGAGTGKTTVIKLIIECYTYYYNNDNILLVAPTGKASRRLASKTDMPASTIHKALRKTPDDDFVFYNFYNPLPHKLVIVDEASMISTELMYDLLSAIDRQSKVIFVGDHNQLYPVGYGEPFFDFLDILPVFELKINHRQQEGTDILREANNALQGKPLKNGRGVYVSNIEFDDIGEILQSRKDEGENPDLQIISPYNEMNAAINRFMRVGVDNLNENDKVILVRNTKDYCNGDIGYIRKISRDGMIVDIDDRTIHITPANYKDVKLAYAITVHKMQGSEANTIIVFIPQDDRYMIDSKMMYTAVTRARKELYVYYYPSPEEINEEEKET